MSKKRTSPIELHRQPEKGQYWSRIHAANGAIVYTSELYTRKHNALKAAQSVFFAIREMSHWTFEDRTGDKVQERK